MSIPETKKVVIFGANGGIGQYTAHALARQMGDNNKQFDIHLVTRKTEGRPNLGLGVAAEIMETYPHSNADLPLAFRDENHVEWEQGNIESLRGVLSDADMVIVCSGEPRRLKNGRAPERAELIASNGPMAAEIGTAIGRLAPIGCKGLSCANPVENLLEDMQAACITEWDRNKVPAQDRPEHKFLGMGPTLDESRLRLAVAAVINKALAAKGDFKRIIARDIAGRVYGQHGPSMVIDRSSIKIKYHGDWLPVTDFLREKGIEGQTTQILDEVEKKTVAAGAKLLKQLLRTAQSSAGERLAELAMAGLYSDKPYTLTGAIVHQADNGDKRNTAYGRRVNISDRGIFPETTDDLSPEVLAKIGRSKAAINADRASHELLPILRGSEISKSGAGDSERVTIKIRNADGERLKGASALLEEALMLDVGTVRSLPGSPPSVNFHANGTMAQFLKLAIAAEAIDPEKGIPLTGAGLAA